MEITYQAKDRDLTILLGGDLDHHAVRGAVQRIERLMEQNMPGKLVFDLKGLSFMDSSGIALLIRTKRRAELMGCTLSVINIPRQAARVLETAGMNRYVELVPGGEL